MCSKKRFIINCFTIERYSSSGIDDIENFSIVSRFYVFDGVIVTSSNYVTTGEKISTTYSKHKQDLRYGYGSDMGRMHDGTR